MNFQQFPGSYDKSAAAASAIGLDAPPQPPTGFGPHLGLGNVMEGGLLARIEMLRRFMQQSQRMGGASTGDLVAALRNAFGGAPTL